MKHTTLQAFDPSIFVGERVINFGLTSHYRQGQDSDICSHFQNKVIYLTLSGKKSIYIHSNLHKPRQRLIYEGTQNLDEFLKRLKFYDEKGVTSCDLFAERFEGTSMARVEFSLYVFSQAEHFKVNFTLIDFDKNSTEAEDISPWFTIGDDWEIPNLDYI